MVRKSVRRRIEVTSNDEASFLTHALQDSMDISYYFVVELPCPDFKLLSEAMLPCMGANLAFDYF